MSVCFTWNFCCPVLVCFTIMASYHFIENECMFFLMLIHMGEVNKRACILASYWIATCIISNHCYGEYHNFFLIFNLLLCQICKICLLTIIYGWLASMLKILSLLNILILKVAALGEGVSLEARLLSRLVFGFVLTYVLPVMLFFTTWHSR